MNIQIRSLGMVALMMATSAAYADARVSVDINPFGWGAPPPPVVSTHRPASMLRLPWSTTAGAIGAIDARDTTVTTVETMTAVGPITTMAAIDADIDTRCC